MEDLSSSSSGAARWPALAALVAWESALSERVAQHGAGAHFVYEFLRFGIKQGWACLFGGLLLGLIIATRLVWPHDALMPRYDFLVLACLILQAALLIFGLETFEEARVILVFHIVGTLMEIFKTATGSWHYPEANYLRIGGVPLFSGFMYAAIGSYLARVWRLFDFRFARHPPRAALAALSVAIYINFFIDHWGIDLRIPLLVATVILFGRTTIYFKVWHQHRHMNLVLGFFLVSLFIWFAENIGTATGAWLYPNQRDHWEMVSLAKLSSWFLLMLISYTLVAFTLLPPTTRTTVWSPSLRHTVAAAIVIAVGLVWTLAPLGLPGFWLHYGGGVLWGAMVLLLVRAAWPGTAPVWSRPLVAAGIALAVELFRLFHTPALDAFRLTLPGTLLLGRIYNPFNVLAYWLGILAAVPIAAFISRPSRDR